VDDLDRSRRQVNAQIEGPLRFKLALIEAIGELYAQGAISEHQLAYATRIFYRARPGGTFREGAIASTRALGWKNRKTSERARRRFEELGILRRITSGHGPGRPAEFVVEIPESLLVAAAARISSGTGDTIESRDTGDTIESPVYRDTGLSRPEQGTLASGTRDSRGPNRGHNRVPQTGEQEEQGRNGARERPPAGPSALRRPGKASKGDRARAEIELALSRAPEEPGARRAERERRLEILAELFVACGQVAPEARLRAYFRTTADIPTELLGPACDAARAAEERGFPPSEAAIIAAGRKLAAIHRKRSRAEPGDAASAGL